MSKRRLLLTPAAAFALSLTACGQPSQHAAHTPPAQPVAAAPAVRPTPTAAAPAWQDLNGARAASGEGELQRRGFELSTRRGLTAFWNHAPSQTCLRVVTSNGRYAVTQVPFQPNCPL